MLEEREYIQATATIASSRWTINKARFEEILRRRGFSKREIAKKMCYGNRGASQESAEQYLSSVLSGRQTKGTPIILAAVELEESPYAFAEVVRCKSDADLFNAVNFAIRFPQLVNLARHAALRAYPILEASGLENCSEKLERDIYKCIVLSLIHSNLADRESIKIKEQSGLASREIKKFDLLRDYITIIRREAARGNGDKYVIDPTGLLTDFQNWRTGPYLSIIEADGFFSAVRAGSGLTSSFSVGRTHAVSRKHLSKQGVAALAATLRDQVRLGIEVAIKFCDADQLDKDHISDIGIIGRFGCDFHMVEAITEEDIKIPMMDMLVERTDQVRFRRILQRCEWARDPQSVDVVIKRLEQVDELVFDLGRENSFATTAAPSSSLG